MTHFIDTALLDEASHAPTETRFMELASQRWERNKAAALAKYEGIELNDEHWAVIIYLRKLYLKQGLPRNAALLAGTLNHQFASQGGNAYLCGLFPRDLVIQGCRLANLPIPPNTKDSGIGFGG